MAEILVQWVFTGAFLILAVVALRAALGRKISAGLRYALWAVVLVRLLAPGQLFTSPVVGTAVFRQVEAEERVSNAEPAPELLDKPQVEFSQTGQGQTTPGGSFTAPAMPDPPVPPEAPAPPDLSRLPAALGWVWLAGAAVLALVLLLCNLRFVRRLRRCRAVLAGTDCPLPVYVAPNLSYSCLCGLIHPAVYVTPDTVDDPVVLRHVLAHELTHFRHLDHIWNVLRCAALVIHWWNPLVWLAAWLSSRDEELACDEGALKLLGDGERAAYGRTLLALSTEKSGAASLWNCATPMAGDKRSLRERVLRIAHAPRRMVWAAVLALASACAFGQASEPEPEQLDGPDPAPTDSVMPSPPVDDAGTFPVHAVHPEQRLRDVPFYSVDEGRTLTLGTMGEVVDSFGMGFEVTRYTLVDLDGDGVQELILWSEVERSGGIYLILHEIGGTLYGYGYGYREMANIKADGTFYDGYVAVGEGMGVGYATMSFTETGCESTPFTYWLTFPSTEDGRDNSLTVIDGQPEGDRSFSDAQEEQELKDNVVWRMNAEILPYAPDLNRNGVPEIVVLSDLCYEDRDSNWYPNSAVEVWENGSLLWQGLASNIHAGENSFLLYSQNGESYLMEFNIYGGFGQAHGDYRIFTLENGTETAVREDHVEFDYCSDAIASVKDNFDPEVVAAFVDEVDGLLAGCTLLVDTGWNYREDALRVDLSWLESYAPGFQWDDGQTALENLQAFRAVHVENE